MAAKNLVTSKSVLAYDSADWQRIPLNAQAVLPYGDGDYRWVSYRESKFAHTRYRVITVEGNALVGSIVDFEPGLVHDADSLRNFVDERNRMHGDATVYCDRFDLGSAVIPALGKRPYGVIIATLDGTRPRTWPGLDPERGQVVRGAQFYNEPTQAYDLTEIYEATWLHSHPGR